MVDDQRADVGGEDGADDLFGGGAPAGDVSRETSADRAVTDEAADVADFMPPIEEIITPAAEEILLKAGIDWKAAPVDQFGLPILSVNLAQCERILGQSYQNIRKWVMQEGAPALKRPKGPGSGQWRVNPFAIEAWRRARKVHANQHVVGQIAGLFTGDDPAVEHDIQARYDKFGVKGATEILELDKRHMDQALRRGELMKARDHERCVERLAGVINGFLSRLPDEMERRLALTAQQVVEVETLLDKMQDEMAHAIDAEAQKQMKLVA